MRGGDDAETARVCRDVAQSDPAGNERLRLHVPVRRILMVREYPTRAGWFDDEHVTKAAAANADERFNDVDERVARGEIVELLVELHEAARLDQLYRARRVESGLDVRRRGAMHRVLNERVGARAQRHDIRPRQ